MGGQSGIRQSDRISRGCGVGGIDPVSRRETRHRLLRREGKCGGKSGLKAGLPQKPPKVYLIRPGVRGRQPPQKSKKNLPPRPRAGEGGRAAAGWGKQRKIVASRRRENQRICSFAFRGAAAPRRAPLRPARPPPNRSLEGGRGSGRMGAEPTPLRSGRLSERRSNKNRRKSKKIKETHARREKTEKYSPIPLTRAAACAILLHAE